MPTPVALGLNGIEDWSASQPFTDVMKCGRPWEARSATQWVHTGAAEMRTRGHVDGDGYPLRIPAGADRVGTIILTEIAAEDDSLNGRYRLAFQGDGDLQVSGGSGYSNGPGWIEFDYTATGTNMVTVEFTRINPANPPRAITCVRTTDDAAQLFRPAWLEVIKAHGLVRFMDWQQTNWSALSRWADRPRTSWATYRDGAPIGVMVALANLLKTDPWFCIPHLATDDFITRFATQVRDTLDPGLTAFFEYSNEVWNWMFSQSAHADTEALKLWPDLKGSDGWMQWYGGRMSQMAELVSTAYTGQLHRRRLPGTTQTGWDGLEDAILDAPRWVRSFPTRRAPKAYITDLSVSGYFGHTLSYDNTSRIQAWRRDHGDAGTRTRMVTALNKEIDGLIETWGRLKAKANAAGLGMVMYEGGSHIVPDYAATEADPSLMPFLEAFHYSDQMAGLYTRAMQAFSDAGGEFFNAFVEVSRPGPHGFWGAKRHVADDNPRWRAIAAFNAAGGGTVPAPVEPIPDPAPVDPTPTPEPIPMPPVDKIITYTHKNSLFDHQYGPNKDADTRVPNWTFRMAKAAGLTYQAGGEFGFASQWAIPPNNASGYENAPSPSGIPMWTNTWQGYSAINALVFVPDNFDSFGRAPDANSNNGGSPVGAGGNYRDIILRHIDAWEKNAPNPARRYCVYAGWADFNSRSNGGQWNSYSPAQLKAYLDWSFGGYHKWYVDLVAMLKKARPNLNIELLDVQRVMMRTWQGTALKSLTGSRLWEDNSPHGTETWYLLAAIVYYMEMFGTKPPANYKPPSGAGVSSVMVNNWSAIVDYAWKELGNAAATPAPAPTPTPAPEPVPTPEPEPTPEPQPTGQKPQVKPDAPDHWEIKPIGDGKTYAVQIHKLPAADPAIISIRFRQDRGSKTWNLEPTVGIQTIEPDPAFPLSFQRMDRNAVGGSPWSEPVDLAPQPVPVDPKPIDPAPVDPVEPDPVPVDPAPVPEVPADLMTRAVQAMESIAADLKAIAAK